MRRSYESATWTGSDEHGFSSWLRTGRVFVEPEQPSDIGVKFNPNHDPANGQFTSGDGGGRGGGASNSNEKPPSPSGLMQPQDGGASAAASPKAGPAQTARPDHPGPTRLADIMNLPSPAAAPRTIRFSKSNNALFEQQRVLSYPGGHRKERGATFFADIHGKLVLQNIGGRGSESGKFFPDYLSREGRGFTLTGTLHTHPYDRGEGSYTGVSFSGADIAALINDRLTISVVQSGPRQFAMLRTAVSPVKVDYNKLNDGQNAYVQLLKRQGHTLQQASRIAAARTLYKLGIAYYQGLDGKLTRVYPN